MKKHGTGPSTNSIMMGAVVGGLVVASGVAFYYSSRYVTTEVIAEDVNKLAAIFQKIDDTCGIIDFAAPKSTVNFLNVKEFSGSQVGSLNLKYPDKWEGPYVQDNPSVQGVEYTVVRMKKGYFVVPGDGVKLPNGKVMGKDIMLDEHSDIGAMMKDPESLMYNGKPLAAKVGAGLVVPQGDVLMEMEASEED